MDANLEPEQDVGFGVGKKAPTGNTTDYAQDDVIILDSMGCNFGTADKPIVIDDESPKKKSKKKKAIEISDDDEEDKIEKEKKKKKRFNEKLFEKSCELLDKQAKTKEKPKKSKNTVDPCFAAELEKIKESAGSTEFSSNKLKVTRSSKPLLKLKKEVAEKEKAAKIQKNKELFEQSFKASKLSKKRSAKEADSGFLDELKRLKKEKDEQKENEEKRKKEETQQNLTPAERLAKIREEMELKRLESISSGEKKDLDKADLRLLFSQKW